MEVKGGLQGGLQGGLHSGLKIERPSEEQTPLISMVLLWLSLIFIVLTLALLICEMAGIPLPSFLSS